MILLFYIYIYLCRTVPSSLIEVAVGTYVLDGLLTSDIEGDDFEVKFIEASIGLPSS